MVVCNLFKECLADSSFGLSVVILCFSGEPSVFTMTSKGNILKRFSSTISLPLVVLFFTQRARHLQVKSSITERKDGLIEGCSARFRARGIHFSIEFKLFSLRHTGRRTICGKKPEKFDPGIYNSIHYIIRFSFVLICLICCFLAPTLLNCWCDDP